MMAIGAALFLGGSGASGLFEACLADHARLKTFSVHIDLAMSEPGKKQNLQYDLAVNGSDALLRVREPASGILDRSDRSFMLKGTKLIAYDAIADERLQRTLKGHDSVKDRFAGQLGTLDDSLTIALDPNAMRKWFSGYKAFRDWQITKNGGLTTIRRSAKGAVTLYRFSGTKPLLREVSITLRDRTLDWKYSFHSGADINLSIPSDARSVGSFTVREAPPKYKTPEARTIVEKMIKAYGRFTTGIVLIDSDEGNSKFVLAGRRLREERKRFAWAFDGNILSMQNRQTGKFYRGKAIRPILAEYITKVGGEVDPIIRYGLAHRVPYYDLFPVSGTVAKVGSAGNSDILDVRTPTLKVSLFVRRDNHLIDSMESETVDRPGKVQTRKSRRFKYYGLGESHSISEFRLSPGKAKVLPLPSLKLPTTKR